MFNVLTKVVQVGFATASYCTDSIKAVERQQRGVSEPLLLKGLKTIVTRDWKSLLSNDKTNSTWWNCFVRNSPNQSMYQSSRDIKSTSFVRASVWASLVWWSWWHYICCRWTVFCSWRDRQQNDSACNSCICWIHYQSNNSVITQY